MWWGFLSSMDFEVRGTDLLADPIYRFLYFTVPVEENSDEITERAIIDSPWIQRLRGIRQLQNVRWVFPSGEHTRFQHVLGAMHLGGRFARRLYPSLRKIKPRCPSSNFVEETLRLAGLLHDVGHGPFGHFFDHNFLKPRFGVTHEDVGQKIIVNELGSLLKKISRSPNGGFSNKEKIEPEHLAFLIRKMGIGANMPEWVKVLKPVVTGIYNIDNLDYVARDSFMCGFTEMPLSVERLLHYSFFTKKGFTLHSKGVDSLKMFLDFRAYMYSGVYFHRTVRALDLHLKEVFQRTLKLVQKENPMDNLPSYLELTEESLIGEVRKWQKAKGKEKQELFSAWEKLLRRETKWKMVAQKEEEYGKTPALLSPASSLSLEQRIREILPGNLKAEPLQIDIASQDPRPENVTQMGDEQLYVFDQNTKEVSTHKLDEYLKDVPSLKIQCRLYALNRDHEQDLARAFHQATGERPPSEETSV
jgi:HD superfamily phosphohydrolase